MKSPILAQVWIDSKPVHFLSTIHSPDHDAAVPAADRTVKRKGKRGERGGIDVVAPPCIRDYNRHMGGVDFADRIKYYNCARHSRRWNRRIIFHLLVNSQCVRARVILLRPSKCQQSLAAKTSGISRGIGGSVGRWLSCWTETSRPVIGCLCK